ncbi:MAG: hypothetical protein PHV98_06000 [Candidatus Omnitrophica bacterium]|nr:hypothetical protein [Candidatus Omnitrophota bacterium]
MCRILVICLMLLFFTKNIFAQEPTSPIELEKRQLMSKNPQAYKEMQESSNRQGRIGLIVTAFRKGEISSYNARIQLIPLVKQEVELEIKKLESEAMKLEQKIASFQSGIDALINQRIEQMLSKTVLPAR